MRPWRYVAWMTAITLAAMAAAVAYVLGTDNAITTAGLIAILLGIFFTFLIGGALMLLVFISAARGHDDDAG